MIPLRAEAYKFTWELRRYAFNYTAGLAAEAVFMGGLYFSFSLLGRPAGTAFIGLLLWFFARGAMSDASNIISEERHLGTFERVSVAGPSLAELLGARLAVNFVFESSRTLLLAAALAAVFAPPFAPLLAPAALPGALAAASLTVLCLYGWGFLAAALQIKWKKTGALVPLAEYAMLVFSGIIFDVSLLGRLEPLALLLPLTWSVKAAEAAYSGAAAGPALTGLAVHAVLAWAAGLALFTASVRSAKRSGEYGFY